MKKTELRVWMDANGYTNVALARELDFSYEYIYKIAEGKNDKYMTETFKFRFINRFGAEAASELFEVAPHLLGQTVPA